MNERRLDLDGTPLIARYDPAGTDHPELLDRSADLLLRAIASFKGEAPGVADGVTIQLGWSWLKLKRTAEGLLVCEGDYSADPYSAFVEHVTLAVSVSLFQTLMLQLAKAKASECVFSDKLMLAPGALSRPRLVLHRLKAREEEDSGWYIGPVEPAEMDRVEREGRHDWIECWELIKAGRGALVSALALPPEYMAFYDGAKLVGLCDPENRELLPPGG